MTHEHLGLNITPPPSQMQQGQRAERSESPNGGIGRQPAHQRQEQMAPRPPAPARNRETHAANVHNPQSATTGGQEMAARLREQEKEIRQLRAQIAAAGPQHQPQQQQQLPQQPQRPQQPQQLQQQPQQQPLQIHQQQQQPVHLPPLAEQPPPQGNVQEALFADEATIEQARALAAARDDGKKVHLPDLIPGFKASTLDIAVPLKADDTFKAYRYVPYTSLSLAARLKAGRGEEDFVVNAQGGLTAKGLDPETRKPFQQ
ncbi:hypothetical protein JB92DRAFT_3121580 [Gautieria morchelliformis]|nr:hypothetical protein JB92DRAFT_3121580 [Gautieria morchelliformis]